MDNRRDFIKGTAWMGLLAAASGCLSDSLSLCGTAGAPMRNWTVQPLRRVRVGCVGLGARGIGAVPRLSLIPGVDVVALCDLHAERVAAMQRELEKAGKPRAREYVGPEAYKALCESDLDVVYNTTPWHLHALIALYAMEHGKHALIEVPSAVTLDECWALVETAERTRRHCMQLENCCYGEAEMLCLSLVKEGLLGELVHGEGAYIHDLRNQCYQDYKVDSDWKSQDQCGYMNHWRLRHNAKHRGNQYETHGLGPICDCMGINRGDRFDHLVSLESGQFNDELFGRTRYAADSWKARLKVAMGDMNTTLIRTAKGRSIMVQHDVSSPRPYRRHNLLTGTNGSFEGIKFLERADDAFSAGNPCHFVWSDVPGERVHHWFDFAKTQEMREKYRHPLWRQAGDLALKVGGHGGMDFLMDLRWAYCLQNALPLDHDVYDLATWCCLGDLTERSVNGRSSTQDVPDFTRGAWKTPCHCNLMDATVDLSKLPFDKVGKVAGQLSV